MVTLLTLSILFLVPICGPQQGNGCAGRLKLELSQGLGAHLLVSPGELLLF
jgi:hypothetical protein